MPAVIVVLFFSIGILAGSILPAYPLVLWLYTLTCFIALLTLISLQRITAHNQNIITLLLCILLGATAYQNNAHTLPNTHYLQQPTLRGIDADFIVTVYSLPEQRPTYAVMHATLSSIRDSTGEIFPATGNVRLTIQNASSQNYTYGTRLHIQGTLTRPQKSRNPGAFNYRAYLSRQRIYGLLHATSPHNATFLSDGHGTPIITYVIAPLKQRIKRIIDDSVLPPYTALLTGILLGDRGSIDKKTLSAFSDSGVIHILAVSGLHVGLVVLVFMFFFKSIRLPSRHVYIATILTLLIYMLLTGLKPSVVRATSMAIMVLLGILLERNTNIINSIAVAGLFILMIWPQSLFDVGFQLSFAATLGIIILLPHLTAYVPQWLTQTGPKWIVWIAGGFMVSLAAQVGTAPLTLFYFNRITLISLIANIIAIPAVFIAVSMGFGMIILGFIHPLPTHFIGLFITKLLAILETIITWLSHIPYAYLEFGTPSITDTILGTILLLNGVMAITSRTARKLLIPLSLLLCTWIVWQPLLNNSTQTMEITFLDAGPELCAHISLPNNQNILINTGAEAFSFNAGKRIVAPYLRRKGVAHIDALIMTNLDNNHCGGFSAVHNQCTIGKVIDSGHWYKSRGYINYQDQIKKHHIPYTTCSAGDSLVFNNLCIYILHPDTAFCNELGYTRYGGENTSLALLLIYGTQKILLTGSPGKAAWEQLHIIREENNFDILQIPVKLRKKSNLFKIPIIITGSETGASSIKCNGIETIIKLH